MERRVAVRGIGFKDGKLLSVLHKDSTGAPVHFWAVPGGGLDPGEDIITGLTREMIEETGITPHIGELLLVQQFTGMNKNNQPREEMEFFFEIKNVDDYQVVDLTKTSHGEAELASIEWIDPKTTNILPAFLQTYDIGEHITLKKPVYLYSEYK